MTFNFIKPDFPLQMEDESKKPEITYNPSAQLSDPYLLAQSSKMFKLSRTTAKCLKKVHALKDQKASGVIRHWNVVRTSGTQIVNDDIRRNYDDAATKLHKKFTLELLDLKIKTAEKDLEDADMAEKAVFVESVQNFRSTFKEKPFSLDNDSFENFCDEYRETQLHLFSVVVMSNRTKLIKENEYDTPNDDLTQKFRTKMEKLLKPKRGRPPQQQRNFKKSGRPPAARRFQKRDKSSNRRNRSNSLPRSSFRNRSKNRNGRKRSNSYDRNYDFNSRNTRKRNIRQRNFGRRNFGRRNFGKSGRSHFGQRNERRGWGDSYVMNLSKSPIPPEIDRIFKNGHKFIPTNRNKSKFLRDLETSQES